MEITQICRMEIGRKENLKKLMSSNYRTLGFAGKQLIFLSALVSILLQLYQIYVKGYTL